MKPNRLTMIVDLDERGIFKAHVENPQGKAVFEFSNEDESGMSSEDGLWLVDAGYMKHGRDSHGLLDYLKIAGIAKPAATLTIVG